MEHPLTLSGLSNNRDELIRYKRTLEHELRAVKVDIDHLEASIRIFNAADTPMERRRYGDFHRAPRGQSSRVVMGALRDAKGPLTSRQIAVMWCEDRGLEASDVTLNTLRKRIGSTLIALHKQRIAEQDGKVGGLIGWRRMT